MSLLAVGAAVAAYAAGVVGVHRVAVARRRSAGAGYASLRRLDWATLFHGLGPEYQWVEFVSPDERGGPALLQSIAMGHVLEPAALASFDPEQQRRLSALMKIRTAPDELLDELRSRPPESLSDAYLREWLELERAVTPFNLELALFTSKQRLRVALARFGHAPALYLARARTSSLLGFNQLVLDDVARAVYFSRQAPFYLQVVLDMPLAASLRPALVRACEEAR
jgi:hypothetical protein